MWCARDSLRPIGLPATRFAAKRSLKHCRGFSLLELVVVIVLISFLMALVMSRLLGLQAEAERVAVETVVGALRSAVGMKVAEHILRQDFAGLRALEGSNPMDRLAELPTNYLGVLSRPDPKRLEDGNWYFDAIEQNLVYLVRNKTQFTGGVDDPPRARFVIRLAFADKNKNGRFDADTEAVEGLQLSPREPYVWKRTEAR